MHATIDVWFEFSIDDDKTVPLAVLEDELTEQNSEATILEQLITSLDERGAIAGIRVTEFASVNVREAMVVLRLATLLSIR